MSKQWAPGMWVELEEREEAYMRLPLEQRQAWEQAEADRKAERRRQSRASYEARQANPTLRRIYELENDLDAMYDAEESASFYLKTADVSTRDADAAAIEAEIRRLKALL